MESKDKAIQESHQKASGISVLADSSGEGTEACPSAP